jgi:hypothetical protein
MFGRVSTVPLWSYANEPNPFFIPYSAIILGKKWTSGYDSDGAPAILSWINSDATSETNYYPEYAGMPDNIPEWVNAYNPSTHGEYTGGGYVLRALVGDGTKSLGPLKLHEALYIYSVLKKLDYGGDDIIEPSIYDPPYFSESEPSNLFIPQYKYYQWDSGVESYSGFYPKVNDDSRVRIAVDADNFSDHYILGVNANYIWRDQGNEYAFLDPSKTKIDVYGSGTLMEVGDVVVIDDTTEGQPYSVSTYTYVSSTVTYNIGEITVDQKLYGFKIKVENFDEEGNSIGIDGDPEIPSSFTVSGTEFWPYKNAAGQPVYNETTGAIINPPIP